VRTIEKGVVINVLEEGKGKRRQEREKVEGKGEREGRKRGRKVKAARRVERSVRSHSKGVCRW